MISAGIILLEVYNSLGRLLPFLGDVLFRLYAVAILYSIHKKYDDEEKEKMANMEIASAAPSENLSNAEAQTQHKPQNLFDKYAEIGGYVFAGVNFVAGIIAMPYFLYAVFTAYIHENQLKDSLVLLAIATLTTILALILFVGISQVRIEGLFTTKNNFLFILAQVNLRPSDVDCERDSSHCRDNIRHSSNHPKRPRGTARKSQTKGNQIRGQTSAF